MRSIIFIAATLVSTSAFCCSYFPPPITDAELVSKATGIVLARVISFEPAVYRPASKRRMATLQFEVVETLKGKTPSRFTLKGIAEQEQQRSAGDFSAHQAPAFWAMQTSNSVSPGDCNHYGIFREHETYLILTLPFTHERAFEHIKSNEDLWLHVVRLLSAREKQ
jgi:hypothetical protein